MVKLRNNSKRRWAYVDFWACDSVSVSLNRLPGLMNLLWRSIRLKFKSMFFLIALVNARRWSRMIQAWADYFLCWKFFAMAVNRHLLVFFIYVCFKELRDRARESQECKDAPCEGVHERHCLSSAVNATVKFFVQRSLLVYIVRCRFYSFVSDVAQLTFIFGKVKNGEVKKNVYDSFFCQLVWLLLSTRDFFLAYQYVNCT